MREFSGEPTRWRCLTTFCQSLGRASTWKDAPGCEPPMRSSRSSTPKKRTSSSPCWLSQSSTARCSSPMRVVTQTTADTSRPAAKVIIWPRCRWSLGSRWLMIATRRPRSVWASRSAVKDPTPTSRPTSRRPLTPSSLASRSRLADSQSEKAAPWKMVVGSTSSISASCTAPTGGAAKLPRERSRSAAEAALRSARLDRVGAGVAASDPPVDAVTSDWVTPDPFPLTQHDRQSLGQRRNAGQIAPGPGVRSGPAAGEVDDAALQGGDHGGGAVVHAQLGEGVQQVGLDRGLADEQGGGDVGVAGAAGDQLQDLDLAGGQGLGGRAAHAADQPGGHRRGQHGLAPGGGLDGREQPLARGVLEQVAGGPGGGLAHHLEAVLAGQHDADFLGPLMRPAP